MINNQVANSNIITIYNAFILVRNVKVFGQKFSLCREGSSLFRFYLFREPIKNLKHTIMYS